MGTRTEQLPLSIDVTLLGILLALLQGGAVALTVFARTPGS